MKGHDILKYRPVLDLAQRSESVELISGFVPRRFARVLVREGQEKALELALQRGFLQNQDQFIPGSEEHYNYFESLITGRNIILDPKPSENFRKIFPAQIFKDSVMACVVSKQISDDAKVVVICGRGHCDFGFGVPERVQQLGNIQRDEWKIISVRDANQVDKYKCFV